MNEPDKPPEDIPSIAPTEVEPPRGARTPFVVGQPVPNREMWVLERELGLGGFGSVWLAKHEWKDERVAVKFCTHPASRHQLVTHEKKVIARVMRHGGDHPNVVPLLDCNLSGETPWLIYEYVPGGTLAEVAATWKDVPLARRLARTVRVMHGLASALSTFHKLDPPIVHRDMKPHNVLMADGKVPRITDFGLGGAVIPGAFAEGKEPLSGHSVMLPAILHAMGTMRYAPQEQMLGSPPSPRDDVYALGVIAYQLAKADLKAVPGTDAQDELREMRVPGDLVALIVKSVAMDPARRPADATEWERRLAKLLPKPDAPPPSAVVPVPPPVAPPPPAAPPSTVETGRPVATLDLGGGVEPAPAPPPVARTPTEAWNELEQRAQAQADFLAGENYYHGHGVTRDYAKAREWFEKAAARGHANALYNLGAMYFYGQGVEQDYAVARTWYEKAAKQGHAGAQNNLGVLSELGRGTPQSYETAREWYEKAAKQGYAAAQNNLGVLFDTGRGVPQDYSKARTWYERAADQGYAAALYNLGVLFENGRGVLQDRAKVREYYEAAAERGHARAQYNLGLMYDIGRGVKQDYVKARRWYERAANQGDAAAQCNLGVLYELGRGTPRDYEKARMCYQKAASAGHAKAKAYLAELYEQGRGITEDVLRALELYREAAAQGDPGAKKALARLARRG